MKKVFAFVLLLLTSAAVSAQNPYVEITPTWYNESGGKVTAIASGDTLVTQSFDLWLYDEVILTFAGTFGDTVHANMAYQLGSDGSGDTTNSFYKGGFKAFVVLDSLANNGARNGGTGICAVKPGLLRRAYDASLASPDSLVYSYGVLPTADQSVGATKVRFVLIGYVGQDNVSTTSILSKTRVKLRRK